MSKTEIEKGFSQSKLDELRKELFELKELLPGARQELSELRKENEELKLKLSGKTFFDEKEVLESQLAKAKGLLKDVTWRYHVPKSVYEEIESFLKS